MTEIKKVKRYLFIWSGSSFLNAGDRQLSEFCDPADVKLIEEERDRLRVEVETLKGVWICERCGGRANVKHEAHHSPLCIDAGELEGFNMVHYTVTITGEKMEEDDGRI